MKSEPVLQKNTSGFSIKRGTSLSHLFVDPDPPSCGRNAYFTIKDVRYIQKLGLDHVRIAVSEQLLWSESGEFDRALLDLLDKIVTISIGEGLRIIVCLHHLRSHPFPDPRDHRKHFQFNLGKTGDVVETKSPIPLFTESSAVGVLCRRWRDLSNRLCHHANKFLAYELFNEPFAPRHDDWNRVLAAVHAEIRALEPNRMLVIGSNLFSVPPTIKRLVLPRGDANLMPSFHFYYANLFTNYGASWMESGDYAGPIRYPGRPIPSKVMESLSEEMRRILEHRNQPVSKQFFRKEILEAVDAGQRLGYRVLCGEFGCIDTVPADLRSRWIGDVVDVLEECGVPWTQWDWKGNFGVLNKRTWRLSGIEGALQLKSPQWTRPPSRKPPVLQRIRNRIGNAIGALGLR